MLLKSINHIKRARVTNSRLFSQLNLARNPAFNYITDKDVSFFEGILGPNAIITDEKELELHNMDWTKKYKG